MRGEELQLLPEEGHVGLRDVHTLQDRDRGLPLRRCKEDKVQASAFTLKPQHWASHCRWVIEVSTQAVSIRAAIQPVFSSVGVQRSLTLTGSHAFIGFFILILNQVSIFRGEAGLQRVLRDERSELMNVGSSWGERGTYEALSDVFLQLVDQAGGSILGRRRKRRRRRRRSQSVNEKRTK